MSEEAIQIGLVRSVNPQQRELRIKPQGRHKQTSAGLDWIGLRLRDGVTMRCKVAKVSRDGSIVTLAPGVTRDSVGRMRGAFVEIQACDVVQQPDDCRDTRHWLGLRVVDAADAVLGTVTAIFEGPANDAFQVREEAGSTIILPAIEQVVKEIDLEAATIRVGDIMPYVVRDDDSKV
jgi:ribosomal 30S subunit maturation factor RimM